ncbi:MAG TPA: hypothetical protein VIX60_04350, partial [Candidatus Cybelea sp.]
THGRSKCGLARYDHHRRGSRDRHHSEHLARNGAFFFGKRADFINGQIDVYKYHRGTFNYRYSFNNGLSTFNGVEGVTYSPDSRQ